LIIRAVKEGEKKGSVVEKYFGLHIFIKIICANLISMVSEDISLFWSNG